MEIIHPSRQRSLTQWRDRSSIYWYKVIVMKMEANNVHVESYIHIYRIDLFVNLFVPLHSIVYSLKIHFYGSCDHQLFSYFFFYINDLELEANYATSTDSDRRKL